VKVRLNLAALTRVEFSKEIEVPDGTPAHELDDMVRKLWDDTDGGEFVDDPDYFEKGHCWWDKLDEDGEVIHA
jgi:hypothetical protein